MSIFVIRIEHEIQLFRYFLTNIGQITPIHQSIKSSSMKKNFWVLLCTALAMFSMASCSKDETAKDSFETIEATVTVPEQVDAFTGSRTMIYDAADGGIELWWGTSEAIGVYGTRLTNKKFTGTNKYKDAASTSFSGATLFSSPKYAYYPYSADNNSNAQTAVKGYLPATQDYSTVIRRLNYDYKIGTYDTWSWSGSKFYFANIVTFARIQVNATGTALEGDELEKVQLIMVMARRAKLYLLDEPIAGVDPAARDYILSTIIGNYNPEAAVVITTHLIHDIEPILDEFAFMGQGGRIVMAGSADETRAQHGKSLDELFREVFKCYANS